MKCVELLITARGRHEGEFNTEPTGCDDFIFTVVFSEDKEPELQVCVNMIMF